MKFATFNTTGALVAAPTAPAFIRVLGYHISGKTAGDVTLTDTDGTVYDYVYETGVAGGGATVPYNPEGHFDVAAGKGLNVTFSGGTIGGVVQYSIRGAGGGTSGIT